MMSFFLFVCAMYWLPTLIAVVRRTPSALGIAVVNFFMGWTVIGWIVALVWALASSPVPHVVYVERGPIRITNLDTDAVDELQTGQVFAEVVAQWHQGHALGPQGARVVVLDLVPPGASNMVMRPN